MNTAKRNKRPGGGNRMGRGMRGPDKSTNIEGVYSNDRFTHTAVNLIGSVVQVQVKNGATYEGVFRTFSGKMDVVLEMAHRLEEGANSKNPTVPSKDTVVNKIIFRQGDILMLTALDVDLDYASKDTFIDSGISKFNGQVTEKELQPWDGEVETASGIEGLEAASGDSANGWDANEMFKTNAEQFNVKSSYDPDLTQYTTPLKPQNTKEYKKREQEAARLAQEIEKTEGYRARADLENGDGDEEKKFSAVIRETTGPDLQGLVGIVSGGKYVPPHLRKPVAAVNNNRGYKQGPPPSGPPPGPSQTSPNKPRTHQPHREESEVKVNGDNKEEKVNESQDRSNTSETSIDHKADREGKDMPSSVASKVDRKNSNPKARDVQIQELKEFSTKFKLSDNESKERERSQSQPGPPPQPNVPPQNTGHMVTGAASPPSHQLDKPEEKKGEEKDKQHDKTFKNVKSTLNPNAKEFVFNPNAKPFTPKHAAQIPTPPRPHTQSPVIVPQQMPSMQGPPIYGPVYSMPTQQQPRFTKKATVSVQRPDFNNAAHAAAAATGPPLLAQTAPQYTYFMSPQQVVGPGGTVQPMYQQMVQVGPGTRMVTPHSMVPQQSHPNSEQVAGMPPGGPGQHQVYVTQQPGAQAVPAHMAAHPPGAQGHPLPTPGHVAPHTHPTPPHSQPSHMNSQSAGPPAPSPVHQHPGPGHQPQQSHPHPQAHPPSSGTPQPPHIIYPNTQMGPQGHPPLQPSPHTPTSPQSMHPQGVFPYPYTSQAAMQNPSQMTYAHSHQHNTITHAQQQHAHSTHAPTQIVMMPGQGSGQLQQAGHPGQVQHVHAMQGHHMQGPGPVPGQGPHMVPHSGVATITVSTPNQQNLHPQMHYVPQQQSKYALQPRAIYNPGQGPFLQSQKHNRKAANLWENRNDFQR